MQKIKRRTFLKASVAAAVVSSVPLYSSFTDYKKAVEKEEVKKIPSICKGCTSYCGLLVSVKNDRVWKVEGHPIHLKSRGHICARGHGMAADIYNKNRAIAQDYAPEFFIINNNRFKLELYMSPASDSLTIKPTVVNKN